MGDADFHIVIPARFASTRFPGKALATLLDKPMVRHVFERAVASSAVDVTIATDDQRIADVARGFGAAVSLTRDDHHSGSDRVAEVAAEKGWSADAIVVNVQGDVPLIPSTSIDQVARLLVDNATAGIATLCAPITGLAEYDDANVVKVVFDEGGRAMYFSRASIPADVTGSINAAPDFAVQAWRHIGIYAYRIGTLNEMTQAKPCALEKFEKLEQLRALWLGIEIRVGVAQQPHGPDVDTPDDLLAAEEYLTG